MTRRLGRDRLDLMMIGGGLLVPAEAGVMPFRGRLPYFPSRYASSVRKCCAAPSSPIA
jgi:hypothetical protein